MPQIELIGVSKTYRDHVSVHALTDMNLTIEKGEFAAAVGPSGSGKTTLLNLIGAIDTPDSGRNPHRRTRHHLHSRRQNSPNSASAISASSFSRSISSRCSAFSKTWSSCRLSRECRKQNA